MSNGLTILIGFIISAVFMLTVWLASKNTREKNRHLSGIEKQKTEIIDIIERAVDESQKGAKPQQQTSGKGVMPVWGKLFMTLSLVPLIGSFVLAGMEGKGVKQVTTQTTTSAANTTIPSTLANTYQFKTTTISAASPTMTASSPQILRLNLATEPDTIDPNKASWTEDKSVISQCFEGLLSFNADGSLKADVATVIPTVANGGISADGLTITFHLKTNVTWSDGKPLTANDFVYSIKREFDPTLACEYASFYFDIVGSEADYSGISGTPTQQATLAAAVGVSAPDNYTLVIKLNYPQLTMLDCMALCPVYPERSDIIAQFGNKWTNPESYIGDGPYILTTWTHQSELIFKPNPNYWGTKPTLSEIDFQEITDANAALAAYQNNELDVVGSLVDPATYLNDPNYANQRLLLPELTTLAFQFNVTKAPFNDVRVRQALSCAIDRDAYINNVVGGIGKPALSWIPPGMPGYNATIGSQYAFNVTEAKQLLAQAGYSDVSKLPQITFSYSNTAANTVRAQFLQGQMKDNLGINIILDPEESMTFNTNVNAGKFMWAYFGWGADYPDPDDWLPGLFGTGAGNNHTGYSNPAFDALSTKALAEQDNTKRLADWDQAQQMVMNDAPIITIFYPERFVLVKPWVKGLTTTGMDGALPGNTFYNLVTIVAH
jgi:oligopeptide transport system substrate-binding protein